MKKYIRALCLLLCAALCIGALCGCSAEEMDAAALEHFVNTLCAYELYAFRDGRIGMLCSTVELTEEEEVWRLHLLSARPDGSDMRVTDLPFVISELVDGMYRDISVFSIVEDENDLQYIYAATYLTPENATIVEGQRRWLYTVSKDGELLKSVELPDSLEVIYPRFGILTDGNIWYAGDNHFLRVDPAAGTSENYQICEQGMASSGSMCPSNRQPQQQLADGRIIMVGENIRSGLSVVLLDPAERTVAQPALLPEALVTGQKVNPWDEVLTVTCETPPAQAEVWNSEGVYRWDVDTGEVVPVFTWQDAGTQLSQVEYVCKAADGTYVMLSPLPETGPMNFIQYKPAV